MTRPLRSTRSTGRHHYYEAVRPCSPHPYSAPCRFCDLRFSLGQPDRTNPAAGCRVRGDRFPCSVPVPEPGSRLLHAGHRLGSKQVSPTLIPRQPSLLGFDVTLIISTRHQRFAHARLPGSHLTGSRPTFSATLSTPALDRRTLRWFAASPCKATAEDLPPSPTQHRIQVPHQPLMSSLLRSWHTKASDRLRSHGLGPPRRMRIVWGPAELVSAWCARTRV